MGLAEVELAYALLARDDGSSVARMVESTAPDGASRGAAYHVIAAAKLSKLST